MLAFVGGGGTPLFLSSQSEYRPTEYLQAWVTFWWNDSKRLQVAKFFQQQRCEFVRKAWKKVENLQVDPAATSSIACARSPWHAPSHEAR